MNAAASRSARRAYINQLKVRQTLLVILYYFLIFFPLIVIAISNTANGSWRSWPREVGSFAGILGLSLMILASVPINRLPPIATSMNQDLAYSFHHRHSAAGFFLCAIHLTVLWINNAEIGKFLNIFAGYPFYMTSAVITLFLAGILVFFTYFRKELKFEYNYWKVFHSLVAVTMVVFGLIHVFGVNYYSASPLIRGYFILITALALITVLWLRVLSPIMQLSKPYRIIEVHHLNNATTEIVLEFAGKPGEKPLSYHSGQIAWISVRNLPFSYAKHPFSITHDDTNQNRMSFAIRELGNFTATVKNLKVGETVYIEGGFGIFNPYKLGDKGLVMIAGGIGIAPVMGLMRSLAARKDKRHFVLYYGSRDRESIGFYDELHEIQKVINLDIVHVLERTDDPSFEKGYITEDIIRKYYPKDKDQYDVFICGPIPMVRIVLPALRRIGVENRNIWPEFYEMA